MFILKFMAKQKKYEFRFFFKFTSHSQFGLVTIQVAWAIHTSYKNHRLLVTYNCYTVGKSLCTTWQLFYCHFVNYFTVLALQTIFHWWSSHFKCKHKKYCQTTSISIDLALVGLLTENNMQHMRKLTLARSLYCRTGVRILNWKQTWLKQQNL